MKSFKDFGIQTTQQAFVGDKIKISRILNREITVHNFKIEDSKQFKGKCLHLQVEVNGTKSVIFTGSAVLLDAIAQVPKDGFPFTTTIVEENDRYEFT